jgi:hypothetical protein
VFIFYFKNFNFYEVYFVFIYNFNIIGDF